jgi:hypothetical protein
LIALVKALKLRGGNVDPGNVEICSVSIRQRQLPQLRDVSGGCEAEIEVHTVFQPGDAATVNGPGAVDRPVDQDVRDFGADESVNAALSSTPVGITAE